MHWELPTREESPPKSWPEFPASLLYGYNVYTTFPWPCPERWFSAHLDRLRHDAASIGLLWTVDREQLKAQLADCYQPDRSVMRLTVFADVNSYGEFYKSGPVPARMVLSIRPLPLVDQPLRLKAIRYQRPLPGIKLGAMAALIWAKRQAISAGFDDVLLVNPEGYICEASTANVFFIREGTLYTPVPERDGCLPGIMREQVLEAADHLNIPLNTKIPLSVWAMPRMEAAFLTNAVQGITPVASMDQVEFAWPSSANSLVEALREATQ